MKRIFLLVAIIFILVGCSSDYKENITEAETAMENGDFEDTLEFYNAALKEKKDSSEVKDMIALLTDYDSLQEEMASFEWSEAFDLANDLLKRDEMVPPLQKEVKELLTTIEEGKEKETQIASELKKIEKLIDKDEVEKARSSLGELESDIKSQALQSKVDDVSSKLEVAEERVAEKEHKEKESEKERLEAEEESKQLAAKKIPSKEAYMAKAQELDYMVAEQAADLYGNNPPSGFYGQYSGDWNDLLDEVWDAIGDALPESEFKAAEAEQKSWEKQTEDGFAEMPDETAGARGAGMDYLVNLTADRTFFLIGKYMD